jgi:hypothetical protein
LPPLPASPSNRCCIRDCHASDSRRSGHRSLCRPCHA